MSSTTTPSIKSPCPTTDCPLNNAPPQQNQSTTCSSSPFATSQASAATSVTPKHQSTTPLTEANLQAHVASYNPTSVRGTYIQAWLADRTSDLAYRLSSGQNQDGKDQKKTKKA
ncbi:hypothetical protein LTR15_002823 [Elasticomyces elasticus]|nr:hypothetical protein LTR15_002823 [Elasticomyces elasticus]